MVLSTGCPLKTLAVQLISQKALTADKDRQSPVMEAAILNGICCPPQDTFKLSAQEPLLKSQREKLMKKDREQRSVKKLQSRYWPLYCVEDLSPQNLNCRKEQKCEVWPPLFLFR